MACARRQGVRWCVSVALLLVAALLTRSCLTSVTVEAAGRVKGMRTGRIKNTQINKLNKTQ